MNLNAMSNGATQLYWVIGAEYADTSFRRLNGGPAEVLGPFESYDDALQTWRERTRDSMPSVLTRYTIAASAANGLAG